jgi:hypothetical protein
MRALFVIALLVALIGPSQAASPAPPLACLAPYGASEPDPDPRNVVLTPSADGKSVKVEACVVSNLERIATLNVFFGVFDPNGNFAAMDGQGLGAIGPIDSPTPDHPRIISLSTLSFPIDQAHLARLLDTMLVEIEWAPCKSASPAPCEPDQMRSRSFLRPYVHP